MRPREQEGTCLSSHLGTLSLGRTSEMGVLFVLIILKDKFSFWWAKVLEESAFFGPHLFVTL